jgi:hypothetical protein
MAKANLDELTRESRNFYERALLKFSGSLFFAALAFMFLGFTSQAGGLAHASNKAHSDGIFITGQFDLGSFSGTSYAKSADQSVAAGTGFACFAYLLAFILCCIMSWYMSPYYGSKQELSMLNTPVELDGAVQRDPIATAIPSQHAHGSLYDGYPRNG